MYEVIVPAGGQTFGKEASSFPLPILAAVPVEISVPPISSNSTLLKSEGPPEGTKCQLSPEPLATLQDGPRPVLPGAIIACVLLKSWIPTIALPEFQLAQICLLVIATSIIPVDSYKIIW